MGESSESGTSSETEVVKAAGESPPALTSRFLRWILKTTLSEDRNVISASSALTKGDKAIIRKGRLSLTYLIHSQLSSVIIIRHGEFQTEIGRNENHKGWTLRKQVKNKMQLTRISGPNTPLLNLSCALPCIPSYRPAHVPSLPVPASGINVDDKSIRPEPPSASVLDKKMSCDKVFHGRKFTGTYIGPPT